MPARPVPFPCTRFANMPYKRLARSPISNQKKKKHTRFALQEEIMFFNSNITSNKFLSVQPDLTRKRNQQSALPPVDDDDDDFLTSDLEISFASTVSLNSPPREPMNLSSEHEPMDISPAPPIRHTTIDHIRNDSKPLARPRAFTSAARTFGRDVSNGVTPSSPPAQQSQKSDARRIQRGALPAEWLTTRPNLNSNQDELVAVVSLYSANYDFDCP
jgi:M-phase inducer tyrosine phosphatase